MVLPAIARTPASIAWAVLMVGTLISWYLGDGHGSAEPATIGVIAVAFLKVYIVGQYFMELREAPLPLKAIFAGWCVVVPAVLIVMYLAT